MNILQKYGNWACVAGAAEGLGKAFSTELANRGFNLILIDKDAKKLEAASTLLKKNVEIHSLNLDLNKPETLDLISKTIEDKKCRFLVYNAAYGPVKPFLANTQEELDLYINVNMRSTLKLVHRFAQHNEKNQAGVLLVSSLAGFRGTQYVVPYAATKAFIWNFAEGLYYEFQKTLMDFSVCCPGATDTPNYRSTNPRKTKLTPKSMDPELVAKEALNKFGKKLFIFPGFSNKFAHFFLNRILPRKIASAIHNSTMYKMYSEG